MANVDAVEKPLFSPIIDPKNGRDFPAPFFNSCFVIEPPFQLTSRIKSGRLLRGVVRLLPCSLLRIPVMRQLLDVVYQAVELPLRIDLVLPSQGESVKLFVVPDIAEHRFHRGKAPPVFRLPDLAPEKRTP